MIGILFADTKNLNSLSSKGISEQVIAMSESLRRERQQDARRKFESENE